MTPTDLEYTFTFLIRGRGSERDKTTKSKVKYPDLLGAIDKALEWWLADPARHYAEVYGPGLAREPVTKSTRLYVLDKLATQIPNSWRVIGLLWYDTNSGFAPGAEYRLYKIRERDLVYPDMPDKRSTEYSLADVADEDRATALRWAYDHGWRDFGVWLRGRPALVFAADIDHALVIMPRTSELSLLANHGQIERAPVRYNWAAIDPAYPLMSPTRSTRSIQKLRSRVPLASEDLAVTPLEILIQKYGYDGKRRDVGTPPASAPATA
jgi:hypothetical protein